MTGTPPQPRDTAGTPTLSVEGFGVEFATQDGSAIGVRSATFDVNPGEILALVGESGSGKSVTAMGIAGLLPTNASATGSIRVRGRQVVGAGPVELRRLRAQVLSVVFQNPIAALNPVFTIGFQIIEAIRLHHRAISREAARERAIGLLEAVGMPSPAERLRFYPHQLSGGQCQRVVIAIALASDPVLLIADEPTTALDVTIQAEVLALLRSIRDSLGMAILLITHDMGVVADMADRVAVMRAGEIVESAAVDDLFSHPSADYTRQLLDAVPRLDSDPELRAPVGDAVEVVRLAEVKVEYRHRGTSPVTALNGVNLSVAAGQMVGIVGESGSGKSTLGKTVLGLTRISSGQVTVLGTRIEEKTSSRDLRQIRKRIGVVFQSPLDSLDPRRSVFESVAEPLVVHRGMRGAALRARVRELLEAVHLPGEWGDRRPRELSGGQLQRVSIARGVALDPELLVADEPTSALDVSVQARVLDTLSELHRSLGFACLFVSHNLAVVSQLCDRIVVMRNGSVVEEASREMILRHPRDPYTRDLINAAPVADPEQQRGRRTVRQLDVSAVVTATAAEPTPSEKE